MTNKFKLLTVFLFGMLLVSSAVFSQEATPEITPEATPESTSDTETTPEATLEATSEPDVTPEATSEATSDPEMTPEVTVSPDVTPEVTTSPETTPQSTVITATPTSVENSGQIVIEHEGLFPEGVEYDSVNGRFLVSSIAEGTVYAVSDDGTTTPFILDERIPSSTGLEVDEAGNRLLVAATDLESLAFLGIYDLTSGENLAFVDFRPLLPSDPEHFANDIAVDAQGNAYVTDSLAGVIYRVDPQGNASVWLEDETFSTQFALNGIAYNEAGNYLIAVRVPGLIKIPLDNPAGFTPVEGLMPIPGEDGIVFMDDGTLAVVSNVLGRVYRVESSDDFATANVTGMFETGPVNPTTAAVRDGEVYVLYAHLNEQRNSRSSFPIQKVAFAEMSQ